MHGDMPVELRRDDTFGPRGWGNAGRRADTTGWSRVPSAVKIPRNVVVTTVEHRYYCPTQEKSGVPKY